jgi:hypothetical protein
VQRQTYTAGKAAAALTARFAARRHDDGTASAVAGHVAWVLLGMMGSWTEQLHALPARAPPSAVFAALREQTTEAEAEEVPLDGAQRRASQVRGCVVRSAAA